MAKLCDPRQLFVGGRRHNMSGAQAYVPHAQLHNSLLASPCAAQGASSHACSLRSCLTAAPFASGLWHHALLWVGCACTVACGRALRGSGAGIAQAALLHPAPAATCALRRCWLRAQGWAHTTPPRGGVPRLGLGGTMWLGGRSTTA
jgi:hypothetical protein